MPVVNADVNAVTPSTNDINRTNGWAHVDATPGIGNVTFNFISTRNFWSCFEHRADNEPNTVVGANPNPLITDGRWTQVCVNNSTVTKTISAVAFVDVRMVYGAETDERFDWTRFDVLPNPDLDGDGVLNEDDICSDTVSDSGTWLNDWGTNRWQVMVDEDSGGLSWYQNKPAKKGKGTIATLGHNLEYTYGCSGQQILEMLSPLGNTMNGHWKFGLSSSVLDEFHLDMTDGVLDGKYLVDTITVNSNSTTGANSAVLPAGVNFTFEVSGTWQNSLNVADAEYASVDGWVTPMDGYGISPWFLGAGEFDLQVDNNFVDWGAYSASHNYTRNFVGTGTAVNFRIFDGDSNTDTIVPSWYGDNSGSLTVKIYAQL